MVKGIGVDIIEIERIQKAINQYGDNFLNKVFTEKEIAYCTRRKKIGIHEFAVRFSAKEAYSKAIGVGILGLGRGKQGIKWKDVEVGNDSLGKPFLIFKGKILKKAQLSLSHSRDYAIASVYVEK
ncbi:holo-[acyl-carrier-protein] synthase [candidate division WOR-1 bacterium RIFOXYC2_FULL_37_10]|uniref:Holo-[acyl-carrier-protein] synthase n=1 Tax=candidate division WOR-1 bacterium RIFOXYB2_FULL_37_13 TaxID=1802579 RepID=A0A1F4SV14_UNCSA|nr:MAG: holo-[acyl-carrier-protein] synthase [candidate division WOR-1 bacterium RIFOXYB2_FULL_37_13]OGC36395.1 MAG: holo-[acyl-carrier-protein] synthase [candidate division WOR-1 bacterium RIFOXYC2_FULL_37_10]